jgi:hypothetical protein
MADSSDSEVELNLAGPASDDGRGDEPPPLVSDDITERPADESTEYGTGDE